MGASMCKYKLNNKEYFVCDKNNNFILCFVNQDTESKSPVPIFNKSEKLLSYLTNNIDNPITSQNFNDYNYSLNLEFNKNNEKLINLLDKEKICDTTCSDNLCTLSSSSFSKFINNYDKTQYNLVDIELSNLINLFKSNPEYSDSTNKTLTDIYNDMISSTIVTEKNKHYYNGTHDEKKSILLLNYINVPIISESTIFISTSDIVMEKSYKENIIKILKDNILIYKQLEKIIMPYTEETKSPATVNDSVFVGASMVIIIILLVIFIIFLINITKK